MTRVGAWSLLLISGLVACSTGQNPGGGEGTQGPAGPTGASVAMATSAPPAGVCPGAGTQIDVGIDANANGTLEPSEVNPALTRYLCDGVNGPAGANGASIVGASEPEPAGTNCPTGGSKLLFGTDADGDKSLDPEEINPALTTYSCGGPQGVQGTAGVDTAVATASEAAGANCPSGGVRLQFGRDANRNGTLDLGEVDATLTRYVCDGSAASNSDFIQNVNGGGSQTSAAISIDGNATIGTGTVLAPAGESTASFQVLSSNPFSPLFLMRGDGALLAAGDYYGISGTPPREGAGTRMMWYPRKAAFRAGTISGTQWDDANMGNGSVAMGDNTRASADYTTAFGLRTTSAQQSAFAAGEDNTASGAASVALGYHAHTNARQGSFVFSDRSSVDTLRAGVNHSANWRVSGGFRVFTASNLSTGVTIQSGASVSNWGQSNAVISTSTGAYLSTSGVWTNTSDANRKHNFEDVSGDEVLEKLRGLPIRSWSYRADGEGVRHLGPTAQDFHATFGLGDSELAIGTVDADGVALAAAQALDRKAKEQRAEIEALRRANAALEARLKRVETLLLEARPGQPRGGR